MRIIRSLLDLTQADLDAIARAEMERTTDPSATARGCLVWRRKAKRPFPEPMEICLAPAEQHDLDHALGNNG